MSATVSQSQNSQSSAKMPSMAPVVMNSNSMNPTPNRSGKSQKIFFHIFKDSKNSTKDEFILTYSAFIFLIQQLFRGWAGTEILLIFWSII